MIRKTDPPDILPRRFHDDFDLPPCVMDDSGQRGLNRLDEHDPLYDERDGLPKSKKHAMHDGEKEEK